MVAGVWWLVADLFVFVVFKVWSFGRDFFLFKLPEDELQQVEEMDRGEEFLRTRLDMLALAKFTLYAMLMHMSTVVFNPAVLQQTTVWSSGPTIVHRVFNPELSSLLFCAFLVGWRLSNTRR